MTTHPLRLRDGHLFVELEDGPWLLDTGAPSSFGRSPTLRIAGHESRVPSNYLGLNADSLSGFVGTTCQGLLGTDILNRFDLLLEVEHERLTISDSELPLEGHALPLEQFMGIPIVSAQVAGQTHRMFFDTGAQVSYFQGETLTDFPEAGPLDDFHPGVGRFRTETHLVPVTLAGIDFELRCGTLPGLLGTMLTMSGTTGILGYSILHHRPAGYFPRRKILVL